MAPIIGRKKDAIRFVVGGDNYGADITYAVFAKIFLVNSKHVRWSGYVHLHVVIKRKSIDVAEIAGLVYAKDHRLGEPVETTDDMPRGNLGEVPMPNGRLYGLKERVFANTL